MNTAWLAPIGVLVTALLTFTVTRYFARRDTELERLRQLEIAAAGLLRIHDRLGVIETAVQTTGNRVSDLADCYDTLVHELHVQGIRTGHNRRNW